MLLTIYGSIMLSMHAKLDRTIYCIIFLQTYLYKFDVVYRMFD